MNTRHEERNSAFPNTSWTLLAAACSEEGGHEALDSLLRAYWQPIYVFFRSRSRSVQDAEDATQGFFESLLSAESLRMVDQGAGRLRAFLLTAAKRFQIDEWRRGSTRKRGGGIEHVPLDTSALEMLYFSGAGEVDGERLYDRSWAYALLATVSDRLRERYEASGKSDLYAAIKGSLEGDGKYQVTDERAGELGLTPAGLRAAVFRLRRQFRGLLESEVAKTCESPEEAREEIAELCRILAE